MGPDEALSKTSGMDEWLAEVGEDGVLAAVEAVRRAVAEGRAESFSNRDEFVAYCARWSRSAA